MSAPSLRLLVLTTVLGMAGALLSKDKLVAKTPDGFDSLYISVPVLSLPPPRWPPPGKKSTQESSEHKAHALVTWYLNTPGCGRSKHNVQGTEVRTWANRSEVASETTEQIFACNALWQVTERQPAKGGEVQWRQGPACFLSRAEDINAKPGPFRPLKQL